ncbi:MAG: hypothetical protein ACFB2X_09525 [Rivularia sp. (in: cyanobacteria)]
MGLNSAHLSSRLLSITYNTSPFIPPYLKRRKTEEPKLEEGWNRYGNSSQEVNASNHKAWKEVAMASRIPIT